MMMHCRECRWLASLNFQYCRDYMEALLLLIVTLSCFVLVVRHRGIQGTHTCKWIPRAVLLSHLPSKGGKGAWRSSRPYLDDHLLTRNFRRHPVTR